MGLMGVGDTSDELRRHLRYPFYKKDFWRLAILPLSNDVPPDIVILFIKTQASMEIGDNSVELVIYNMIYSF